MEPFIINDQLTDKFKEFCLESIDMFKQSVRAKFSIQSSEVAIETVGGEPRVFVRVFVRNESGSTRAMFQDYLFCISQNFTLLNAFTFEGQKVIVKFFDIMNPYHQPDMNNVQILG